MQHHNTTLTSPSAFHDKYPPKDQVYGLDRPNPTCWLGTTEHYASMFVNPALIGSSNIAVLFRKQQST
jgi:hypothetical protein